MTKYILHGGYSDHLNPSNDKFFAELIEDSTNGSDILLVYFAKTKDRWEEKSALHGRAINRVRGDKEVNIVVASEEEFEEQVKKASAVYIHGGETPMLLPRLKKYSSLESLFEGKTVAGESAGAYVLSKYHYSNSRQEIYEGLGLLPVRLICHYLSDKHQSARDPKELMKGFHEELELVVLKDYEWKMFNV